MSKLSLDHQKGFHGKRRAAQGQVTHRHAGKCGLAAITPNIVADCRDDRLTEGLAATTVRLELALLSHLYTVAI